MGVAVVMAVNVVVDVAHIRFYVSFFGCHCPRLRNEPDSKILATSNYCMSSVPVAFCPAASICVLLFF